MSGRGGVIGSDSISTRQPYYPDFFFRSTLGSSSFDGNGLPLTEDVSHTFGDGIFLLTGLGRASLPT